MIEQVIRALLSQGVPGILAAVFIWLYVAEKGEVKRARAHIEELLAQQRDASNKVLEQHSDEVSRMLTQHSDTRAALVAEHSEREKALLEQINDLREAHSTRERASLQTIEYFARAAVEAVEDLSHIADALRKAYDRRGR